MVTTTTPNPDDTPAPRPAVDPAYSRKRDTDPLGTTERQLYPEPAAPPRTPLALLEVYDTTELSILKVALTEFGLHMTGKSPLISDIAFKMKERLT